MLILNSVAPVAHRRPIAKPANAPSEGSKILLPAVGGLAVALPAALWGHSLGDEIQGKIYRKGFGLLRDGSITLRQAFDALPYVRDRAVLSQTAAIALGAVGFAAGATLIWYAQRQQTQLLSK